jgi:prepilin-type N-terminal cleavage/methylation domain-containing protein
MNARMKLLHGDAGFTLVETMVALVLLSVISVFIFWSLRSGTALWANYATASEETDDVATTQDLLRRLIERSYPAPQRSNPRVVNFSGNAARLEFQTSLPPYLALGGFYTVSLERSMDDELLISWRDSEGITLPGSPAHATLLSGVSHIALTYFGARNGAGSQKWFDSWTGQPRLPDLVRIQIAFGRNDRAWPDLIVSPRLTTDATCVYDALTADCRGR